MLPIGVKLELYNIIRDWARECDATISFKVNSTKKQINLVTDKPGVLIGGKGKTIDKYTYALRQWPEYRDYSFTIEEIAMMITPESPKITEKEYLKDLDDYFKSRFEIWEEGMII